MLPLKRHNKRDLSMKKTILALFLLLFILIVTCAYEKSHTIYAKTAKEHTAPLHNTEPVSIAIIEKPVKPVTPPVKEQIIADKTLLKKNEVKMVVQSEKEKAIVAKSIEKQTEVKTVVQSEKETPKPPISENTSEEEAAEKTLLAKLKSAVLKRLQSFATKIKEEETEQNKPLLETQNHQEVKDLLPKVVHNTSEEESKPVALENASAVIENIALTVTYNTSEEEIVDHLVEALRNQELAFKNRDKFMLEIEALIQRALDDRCAAIAYIKKEELALEKTQKVLLDERDLNTKKIPEPYTINPGE